MDKEPSPEPIRISIVICVVTSDEGKVLVVKRAKPEVAPDGSVLEWTFPSGKIQADANESVENAAVREIKEETGCDVSNVVLLKEKDHEQFPVKAHYVAAKIANPTTTHSNDPEVSETRWVSKQELKTLVGTRIDPDVLKHLKID